MSHSNQVACVCACVLACMYVCMHPSRWANTVSIHSSGVSTSESEPEEARTRVPVDMRSFFDCYHVHSVPRFPKTGEDGSQFPFLLLREKGQAYSSLTHFSISPSPEPTGWKRE